MQIIQHLKAILRANSERTVFRKFLILLADLSYVPFRSYGILKVKMSKIAG